MISRALLCGVSRSVIDRLMSQSECISFRILKETLTCILCIFAILLIGWRCLPPKKPYKLDCQAMKSSPLPEHCFSLCFFMNIIFNSCLSYHNDCWDALFGVIHSLNHFPPMLLWLWNTSVWDLLIPKCTVHPISLHFPPQHNWI